MDKVEIEKNRLELAYNRQLQLVNFVLIGCAGGLISLFIGLILSPERLLSYVFYYGIAFIMSEK